MTYAAQRIAPRPARRFFPAQNGWQRLGLQKPPAYGAMLGLIAEARGKNEEWVGQYRPAYAKFIPAWLRPQADRIYRECFPVPDPADFTEEVARLEAQIGRLTETIGG